MVRVLTPLKFRTHASPPGATLSLATDRATELLALTFGFRRRRKARTCCQPRVVRKEYVMQWHLRNRSLPV